MAGRCRRRPRPGRVVVTDRWQQRINALLAAHPMLLSTSIHDIVTVEEFTGSHPTTVRAARTVRGPRFIAAKAASVPIETEPAAEVQCDFADLRATEVCLT